jgi:hypothetical protein
MAGAHARLSPSGAHRWVPCPGSAVLEKGRVDAPSRYAAEGTAAHEIAAAALRAGTDAAAYVGRTVDADGFQFTVDENMARGIQPYLDLVRQGESETGGTLQVEQSLPITDLTGEEGAAGTGDAIILTDDTVIVIDLKFGMGERVDAEGNQQLGMYGLAALDAYDIVGDLSRVRMIICQPRVDHVSEWVQSREELNVLRGEIATAAMRVREADDPGIDIGDFLLPGEKQCRWCKAKPICPALRSLNAAVMFSDASVEDFDDLTKIARANADPEVFAALSPALVAQIQHADAATVAKLLPFKDLALTWWNALQARADELVLSGIPVEGFKAVQGKQGNRTWADAAAAEAALKAMRLKHDQIYSYSLISPTAAEKLLAKDSPKRWKTLQPLITRADGKPTVVPASDKRPAIQVAPVADDFSDLTVPPPPPEPNAPTAAVEDIC